MKLDDDLESLENLLLGNRTVSTPDVARILAHSVPQLIQEAREIKKAIIGNPFDRPLGPCACRQFSALNGVVMLDDWQHAQVACGGPPRT